MRLAVLNGPNLNLLGSREPEVYGRVTLSEIETAVRTRASEIGVASVDWMQSNSEGALVSAVQALADGTDGALINAGAYSHYSLALRDALLAVRVPFVEVHLSNVFAREPARHHSVMADLAIGVMAGFGARSYVLGLEAIVDHLRSP